MSKQEDIDRAADQAATQASAITITWIKAHLRGYIKGALKEIWREVWTDLLDYILHTTWVKVLGGLMFLLGLVGWWLKNRPGS